MLYEFKGSNGKIELYENKIVIIRNAFSVMARGSKEIYIKNLTGVQIKKPGLTAGYIQFVFSGSKEVKSSNITDVVYDENTVVFQQNGYQNALVLKQKIEELLNKPNETRSQNTYSQPISQADELIKFKQLLDSGAITEEEFVKQKERILGSLQQELHKNVEVATQYEEHKHEIPQTPITNNFNTNMKNDKKRRKKALLILFAIIFLFVGIIVSFSNNDNSQNNESTVANANTNTNVSLGEVEKWYENQTPNVLYSFIEYAKSVDGISAINVSDSKFRFGENSGWYDCHYTIYFTCKINGEVHSGESRAFLKYNESDINFFSFEIFDNNGIVSIVEHYDAEYDKIIEDYYKELIGEKTSSTQHKTTTTTVLTAKATQTITTTKKISRTETTTTSKKQTTQVTIPEYYQVFENYDDSGSHGEDNITIDFEEYDENDSYGDLDGIVVSPFDFIF